MKFTTLSISLVGLLANMVVADWSLYSTTCCGGLSEDGGCFSNDGIGTADQGACDGFSLPESWGDNGKAFTTVNPCNSGEQLSYLPNGDDWNIYIENTNTQVGTCSNGDLDAGDCYYGLEACVTIRSVSCHSTHCN